MNCRKCNGFTRFEEVPKRKDGTMKEQICSCCQLERRNRRFRENPEKHQQYLDYLKRWRQVNRQQA